MCINEPLVMAGLKWHMHSIWEMLVFVGAVSLKGFKNVTVENKQRKGFTEIISKNQYNNQI